MPKTRNRQEPKAPRELPNPVAAWSWELWETGFCLVFSFKDILVLLDF